MEQFKGTVLDFCLTNIYGSNSWDVVFVYSYGHKCLMCAGSRRIFKLRERAFFSTRMLWCATVKGPELATLRLLL